MENDKKVILVTYQHILGATIAKNHLDSSGFETFMDDDPQEGNANIYVWKHQYNQARQCHDQWKKEIKEKHKTLNF